MNSTIQFALKYHPNYGIENQLQRETGERFGIIFIKQKDMLFLYS